MRYEIDFLGRVQGVGFRATAHRVARDFPLVGWVRNEPDGSVKLVIEGEQAELDRYLAALRRAMGNLISSERLAKGEDRGGYSGFEIR